MAKFSIEFDSVTKNLSISRDGEMIENVEHVEVFKAYVDPYGETEEAEDKFHVRVVTKMEDEENGVVELLTIMANEVEKKSFRNEVEEAMAKHFGVL